MAYKNGAIPARALRRSTIGVSLRADAAASADRLAKEIKGLRATDGYRALSGHPYAQREIFLARYEPRAAPERGPFGDVRWYNGVRYVRVRGAAAAIPGTSNHGLGLAVDFASGINGGFGSAAYKAFAKVAPRHGWSNTEGRSVNESWHWVYNPAKDRYPWRKIKVTGTLDKATIYAIQRALGRPVTAATTAKGEAALWRAIQSRLNKRGAKLAVDGIPGAATYRALQADLRKINRLPANRPKVDGLIGPATVRAWQKALNAKKW